MARDRIILQVDGRRRISLGHLGQDHTMFLAEVDGCGVITLTPAVAVPADQAVLLRHPEVYEAIRRAQDDPGSLVRAGRPVRKED